MPPPIIVVRLEISPDPQPQSFPVDISRLPDMLLFEQAREQNRDVGRGGLNDTPQHWQARSSRFT